MRRYLLVPLLLLLLAAMAPAARAGVLSADESAALRQDVQAMMGAFAAAMPS